MRSPAPSRLELARASGGISSEIIYRLVLRELAQLPARGDTLEIGAGLGRLTPRLAAAIAPHRLTGIDLLPRPENLAAEIDWRQSDLDQPLPFAAASFQTLICTEVISYLENPRALFREFARVLRPGGDLLLTLPNQESLRSYATLLFAGHFTAFKGDHPGHLTALLRADLARICAETGFVPPRFVYTDSGGLPKAPRLTWQRISFGLLRGRLFSDNLLCHSSKM